MTIPDATSPWHAGEVLLQATVGAAERMAEIGPKIVRRFMPDQHRQFFETLPFALLGSVSPDGAPHAALITGEPGFIRSVDDKTLIVKYRPREGDPAAAGMGIGGSIGLLGIELHTRRRNRVNGRITAMDGDCLTLHVEQSFGNCPKYIQLRAVERWQQEEEAASHPGLQGGQGADDARDSSFTVATALSESQRRLVENADTMFVATYVEIEDASGIRNRQVDVSHRGGKPGFARVSPDGILTIPDFTGNNFFNTLGNIASNPRAGLLFIDFDTGATLEITGHAAILFDTRGAGQYAGARRYWTVKPQTVCQSGKGALGITFRPMPDSLSPFLADTGDWRA